MSLRSIKYGMLHKCIGRLTSVLSSNLLGRPLLITKDAKRTSNENGIAKPFVPVTHKLSVPFAHNITILIAPCLEANP